MSKAISNPIREDLRWPHLRTAYAQKLTAREREVFDLRYPEGGGAPPSVRSIAEQLSIRHSRVTRLEQQAISKLLEFSRLPVQALAAVLDVEVARLQKKRDQKCGVPRPRLAQCLDRSQLNFCRFLINFPFFNEDGKQRHLRFETTVSVDGQKRQAWLELHAPEGFPPPKAARVLLVLFSLYNPERALDKIFFRSDTDLLFLMQDPQPEGTFRHPKDYDYARLKLFLRQISAVRLSGENCFWNIEKGVFEDIENLTLFPGTVRYRRRRGEIVEAYIAVHPWFAQRLAPSLFRLAGQLGRKVHALSDGALLLAMHLQYMLYQKAKISRYAEPLFAQLGLKFTSEEAARKKLKRWSQELVRHETGVLSEPVTTRKTAKGLLVSFHSSRKAVSTASKRRVALEQAFSPHQEYLLEKFVTFSGEESFTWRWREWIITLGGSAERAVDLAREVHQAQGGKPGALLTWACRKIAEDGEVKLPKHLQAKVEA